MSKIVGRKVRIEPDQAEFDFVPFKDFTYASSEYVKGYRYRVAKGDDDLLVKAKLLQAAKLVEIKEPTDGNYACN